MPKIDVFITQKNIDKVKNSFVDVSNSDEDISEKVNNTIDQFHHLIEHTKSELLNYLTENEALLICDALNSGSLSTQVRPVMQLAMVVQDGIMLKNLGEKWKVNAEDLLKKIRNLTEAQAYTIMYMSREFWGKTFHKTKANIREIFLITND